MMRSKRIMDIGLHVSYIIFISEIIVGLSTLYSLGLFNYVCAIVSSYNIALRTSRLTDTGTPLISLLCFPFMKMQNRR